MRSTVILCEGYHDRAFWSAWLNSLSIRQASKAFQSNLKNAHYDPGKGEYALATQNGDFVGIRPVGGLPTLRPNLRSLLNAREQFWVDNIILTVDPDTTSDDQRTGIRPDDVLRFAQTFDPEAVPQQDSIALWSGRTTISLVRWEVLGDTPPGVPEKQTLERLVCTAIREAYPVRGDDVQQWLDNRTEPPGPSPKAFSWSYMAGWEPEAGCDRFFGSLWEDARIARALERHLRANGAWEIAERLG